MIGKDAPDKTSYDTSGQKLFDCLKVEQSVFVVKIEGKSSSWQEEEKVEGLHLRLGKRRKEA